MGFKNFMRKTTYKIKDNGPEIVTGLGIISMVAGFVVAVKKSPKAVEATMTHKANIRVIENARDKGETENGDDYTESDYRKDVVSETIHHAGRIVKAEALPIALETAGAALVVGGAVWRRKNYKRAIATCGVLASQVAALQAAANSEVVLSEKNKTIKDEDGNEIPVTQKVVLKKTQEEQDAHLMDYVVELDASNWNYFGRVCGNRGDIERYISNVEAEIQSRFRSVFDGSISLDEILDIIGVDKGVVDPNFAKEFGKIHGPMGYSNNGDKPGKVEIAKWMPFFNENDEIERFELDDFIPGPDGYLRLHINIEDTPLSGRRSCKAGK